MQCRCESGTRHPPCALVRRAAWPDPADSARRQPRRSRGIRNSTTAGGNPATDVFNQPIRMETNDRYRKRRASPGRAVAHPPAEGKKPGAPGRPGALALALSEQRQVVCVGRSTRRPKRRLGREGAPLGQRGGAPLFVDLAGDEMALLIEMVVDLGMNWAEFLQRLHASKRLHGPFSSSKRLM